MSKKRIGYFFFLLAFVLIALEVTGRIYLKYFLKKATEPKFRFNSYRIYEHVPGFTEGDKSGNWMVINKQGFRRSSDVAFEKPDNTIRIFLMGASSAHGISSAKPFPVKQIYNHETIDAYLEKLLIKQLPQKKIEVINAAVTGYQFFQQTSYLMNEIVRYYPDLVIFFDGANDCYISNTSYSYYDDNKFQFWKARLQRPSIGGFFDYGMLWCSRFSGFARGYLSWKGIKDAEELSSVKPSVANNIRKEKRLQDQKLMAHKTWLPVLQTNFNILKQHQIKTVFALQPMLVLRNEHLQSNQELAFKFSDPNCEELYGQVTAQLDSICKLNQVQYIDFVPSFNDSSLKAKQLFIDYCHLTPIANEIIARKLASSCTSEIME